MPWSAPVPGSSRSGPSSDFCSGCGNVRSGVGDAEMVGAWTVAAAPPPGRRVRAPATTRTAAAAAPTVGSRRRRRIERPRSAAPTTSGPRSGPTPSSARSKVADSFRPSTSDSFMVGFLSGT